MGNKKHCYDCAYKREVPGNCHIECMRSFEKVPIPELNSHGVKNGWCIFPTLFDPVWVGKCKGFAKIEKKENLRKETSPLNKIFSILASVGR